MSSKDDVGKNVSARAQAVGGQQLWEGPAHSDMDKVVSAHRVSVSGMSCQVFSCLFPVTCTKARQGVHVVSMDPPHRNLYPRRGPVNEVFLCPWVMGGYQTQVSEVASD